MTREEAKELGREIPKEELHTVSINEIRGHTEMKDTRTHEELEKLKREIRWVKIVLALWFTGEALIHFLKLMGVLS